MITFTVPGLPIAQPRQRHRVLAAAGRSFVQNYTPTRAPVNVFKACVAHAFAAAYSGSPIAGPVSLSVLFFFPRPKAMIWKTRAMLREPHAKKPDIDNCLKSLKDALKGLAWLDDSQVAFVVAQKWTAAGDEQSRTEIKIAAITPV